MTSAALFYAREDAGAKENLDALIFFAKHKLIAFGRNLDFESDVWDISGSIFRKGRRHSERIYFTSSESDGENASVAMCEPFKSFAKSYFRYRFSYSPSIGFAMQMRALRAIESALVSCGASSPVDITTHILHLAANIVKANSSNNSAYSTACQIKIIGEFLNKHRLVNLPFVWKNPLKRTDPSNRVGADADIRRAKRMPSQTALDALPIIFRQATTPSDIMVSSVCAILCSAPDRINEVLLLPTNCEVHSPTNKLGDTAYGLRWWPAKGAEPMIKWIIPSMSGVVQEAIKNIKNMTESARKIAKWYEDNPTKLYLGGGLEHLRQKEWLTMSEVASIIYDEPVYQGCANQWCRLEKIDNKIVDRKAVVRFSDVQRAVLNALPRNFPIADQRFQTRFSDSLFVVKRHSLHSKKTSLRCIIEAVTIDQIHNRLGARSDKGVKSIFDSHNFVEADGSPVQVRTNQFRHFLNTLAQTGGLSQLDIAKWSGRRDIRQNAYYDHETTEQVVARIRSTIGDDARFTGPVVRSVSKVPIVRSTFDISQIPTGHTTDFGYCVHDYVMSPCELHRDCFNCHEQVCVKGDAEKEARIRAAYSESTILLNKAERAVLDGVNGAEDWGEHQRALVTRLRSLVGVLDDPAVPAGASIRLTAEGNFSPIADAVEARSLLEHPDVKVQRLKER